MKLIDGRDAVVERQLAKFLAPAVEERIICDHESVGLQADNVCHDRIDIGCGARLQDMQPQAKSTGCRLQVCCLNIAAGESRIDQRGNGASVGQEFVQHLQSLPTQLRVQ